jgi:hypothetical protein
VIIRLEKIAFQSNLRWALENWTQDALEISHSDQDRHIVTASVTHFFINDSPTQSLGELDGTRMGESDINDAYRTVLEGNYFSVDGRSIGYYEEARTFFLELNDGSFEKAFKRLFITSHDFDDYNFRRSKNRQDLINEFKTKYHLDDHGACICVVLRLETERANTENSVSTRVYFPSNGANDKV